MFTKSKTDKRLQFFSNTASLPERGTRQTFAVVLSTAQKPKAG